MSARAPRARSRLSRTASRARWGEYRRLLDAATAHGYAVVALEDWVRGEASGSPLFVLRHDVDQHPRSALAMAGVEREVGVRSTWYFRWRTADPAVIRSLRDAGFSVGLHYETLSRAALETGARDGDLEALLDDARRTLRAEVAAFERMHGPIRSMCPHGDSRVPAASNAVLLRNQDPASYGVEFDGNEAMRSRGLAYWLTDRSAAEGGWKDAVDPGDLLLQRASPILCLTHPNNWTSGPGLWLDRLLRAALPAAMPGPVRTRSDAPPL